MHYTFFKRIKESEKEFYPENRDDYTFETTETLLNVLFMQGNEQRMVKSIRTGAEREIEAAVTIQVLMNTFVDLYASWENAEQPYQRASSGKKLIELYDRVIVKRQKRLVFERSVVLGIFIGTAIGFCFCRFV
jgi:hypothetical protein